MDKKTDPSAQAAELESQAKGQADDGSYRIQQAKHIVDSSGYTTQVRLQKA